MSKQKTDQRVGALIFIVLTVLSFLINDSGKWILLIVSLYGIYSGWIE